MPSIYSLINEGDSWKIEGARVLAVLGDRLQYVIVKGHDEGVEAIEYLKKAYDLRERVTERADVYAVGLIAAGIPLGAFYVQAITIDDRLYEPEKATRSFELETNGKTVHVFHE